MSTADRQHQPVEAGTREQIVSLVEEFARREVAPGAEERDAEGGFPRSLWEEMAGIGLHGLAIPAEYGGVDLDMGTICAAGRVFGRAGRDFGLGLSWLSSMYVTGLPIVQLGTPEQIDRYVPGLVDGNLIGSQAITEPHAGSDVGAIRTRAVRTEAGWRLNGSKIFISNAPVADVFLVLAVTDPEAGRRGLSLFIVERDTPGFTIGEPMKKMGAQASPTAEVFLDDCELGADALLGRQGSGFYDFLGSASDERLVLTALTLGVFEAAFDIALRYSKEREQFGSSISDFQAIRLKLADMAISIDACAGLIEAAARRVDAGEDARHEISAAKVFVSETALRGGIEAMQVLGGYGYMREYQVERLVRDIKLMTVGGGTNEIHRDMIARGLLSRV